MGISVRDGLICGDLFAGKFYILKNLKKKFCPLSKVYDRETTLILHIFEFTKVSGCKIFPTYKLNTSVPYFFMRTIYIWLRYIYVHFFSIGRMMKKKQKEKYAVKSDVKNDYGVQYN